MADVELAVEMIGFVHQRAGEQFLAGGLEVLAIYVLRADGHPHWPRNFLAKIRNTEAALAAALLAFRLDDLRIYKHQFRMRILFEADVNHCNPPRNGDLRRRQPDTMSRVHGFEHVLDQLSQMVIESGNRFSRFFQDGIAVLNDRVDQVVCSFSFFVPRCQILLPREANAWQLVINPVNANSKCYLPDGLLVQNFRNCCLYPSKLRNVSVIESPPNFSKAQRAKVSATMASPPTPAAGTTQTSERS